MARPPVGPAQPTPPPAPVLEPYQKGKRLESIDAALALLTIDAQPKLQQIVTDLQWLGPRGGDDIEVESRIKYIRGYNAKVTSAQEVLIGLRRKIELFAQNEPRADIKAAMSIAFPSQIDVDLQDYVMALQELPTAATLSPMDSMGHLTLGHIKVIQGKLSVVLNEIAGAIQKLTAMRKAIDP